MENNFGSLIHSLRKDKNLTLDELSKKARIGLTYLSKIEHNKTGSPEVKTIEKLATALEVDSNTKEELFRLAKQIPPDFKESITRSKAMYEVFRSAKGFDEQDLLKIVEEIKKRKKARDAKNIKK